MKVKIAQRQKGLSLIELMIAIVLGLLITGGMIQLFVSSKQTYRIQENLSRLQENGRFAMHFLTHDIRMAGHMGCNASTRLAKNILNDTTSFNFNFNEALIGFNASGANNWSPTVPDEITLPLTDHDIITIRGVLDTGVDIIGQPLDATNCDGTLTSHTADLRLVNNTTFDDADDVGTIVLAGNCESMAIFQISDIDGEDISHETGGAGPGNMTEDLGACFAGKGRLYKLSTRSYYIRNNPQNNAALYRKDGIKGAEEMVEGIVDMQILYGEDTDNDKTPNYYLPAGSAGLKMDNVVSVRISLVASSLEDNLATEPVPYTIFGNTITPTDRRIYRVFTSTIAIRNRLP